MQVAERGYSRLLINADQNETVSLLSQSKFGLCCHSFARPMCVSYKQHVSKPVELVELDQELKEKPKHKPVVSEYSKLGRERAFLYSFLTFET